MAGNSQANGAAGSDGIANRRRQAAEQTFGMMVAAHNGHGPRPAAASQSLPQRRHVRNVIERFFGALDSQRERRLPRRAAFGSQQPIDSFGIECAGRYGVDGLGGEGHEFAFSQCLHGTVYAIARIVSAAYIDHKRRHRKSLLASAAATTVHGEKRTGPNIQKILTGPASPTSTALGHWRYQY